MNVSYSQLNHKFNISRIVNKTVRFLETTTLSVLHSTAQMYDFMEKGSFLGSSYLLS